MWYDPDDRISKALVRYEEGDLRAASAMLRALDRRGVESPRIDLYLGHCHLEQDRPEAALRRYRRAVRRSPADARAWIGVGLSMGRMGRLDSALRAFRRAARIAPDLEDAHCNLVHCYGLVGRLTRAKMHARRVLELDPACPLVHRHMAVAYLVAGQPARALEEWRRVAVADPGNREVDIGLGRALAALGRAPEARRRYLRALAGEYAGEARLGLGDLARSVGDLEEAADHYRRAVAHPDTSGPARLRAAETLLAVGRTREAAAVLRPEGASSGGEPDGIAVAALLAEIDRREGRRAAGLRRLRRIAISSPAAWGPRAAIGEYLLDSGRPRAAIRALRSARRIGGGDPIVERLCARAWAAAGRPRRGISILARAADRVDAAEDLQLEVAAAHLAVGRLRSAERAALRSLVRFPRSAPLWSLVAEIAIEGGRVEVGRSRLRRALREDPRCGSALELLVRVLLSCGRYDRAVNAAFAAIRVVGPASRAARDLGAALLAESRPAEAALYLRKYALARPGDAGALELLAEALAGTGDSEGARMQRVLASRVARRSPAASHDLDTECSR
jgi:predicted Zn-dependent protease